MPCVVVHLTQDTLKELQAFISNTENSKSQDAAAESTEGNNKSHDAAESEPPDDPPSKRAKLEPSVPSEEDTAASVKLKDGESCVCVVCLGILQELCGTTQAVKVCVPAVSAASDWIMAQMNSMFCSVFTDSGGCEGRKVRV